MSSNPSKIYNVLSWDAQDASCASGLKVSRWPGEFNLGHLGHFFGGSLGLICKLNYLDVTRIAITCSLENNVGIWYASELWVWWMHWNIIGGKPAYYLKLFWSMWCPKISSSRSLCKGPVLYSAKNEEIYDISYCSISKNFHVMLASYVHYF